MEDKKYRQYTQDERRRILASVYQIINTKAMSNRYSGTIFGMNIDDDPNSRDALGFYNLLECIAQMHNEIKTQQAKKAPND